MKESIFNILDFGACAEGPDCAFSINSAIKKASISGA